MNNDYIDQEGVQTSKLHWFQKTQTYTVFTNPMFILCIILFTCIVVAIYWRYFRPKGYKTIYKKLLHFEGFKYSHLTNQEREQEMEATPDVHGNSHFIIYGSSGSGKTSFLKHYLSRVVESRKSNYKVFGRDEREFPSQNYVPLLQLENVSIASLENKIVVLDDAGAYKSLKTKV